MGLDDQVAGQVATLYRCRNEIISDLDVQDVLPELLSKLVIEHRDKQLVDHENTLEDKSEKLLSILEEKAGSATSNPNPNVIPIFIDSLKAKYRWIYDKLCEDVPDSRVIPLMPSSLINKRLDIVLLEDVFHHSEETKTKKMLESGGVQCLPANAIERKDLLERIRTLLKELKSHCYLVLQGMAGSGKSVLATQAISDIDLVHKVFPGGVFFLVIGKECSESKDALLAKMRILCEKLGESRAPNSFEHGADILRTAFLRRTNTLLILDDVWRPEVIRAFDVGCRILVTTRDLSVMDVVNGRFTRIYIKDGFSEEESLDLFSQALKINRDNLPDEAMRIHHECKGSPMVISLISSLLHEHEHPNPKDPDLDVGRWQYYLESLTKRKYSKMTKNRRYEHENIIDAISLSFEGLSEANQELYSDFALFQDDVGIPSPVLTTLWSMQKYEVEDVMKNFVRKSLVIEEYDPQKKCYVYSIHDLLLDYLKTRLHSQEDLEVACHKKLVEKYLDACNGEFHKLPDDGYIHFYLGYHLYKSKMYHYFQKVYFDLQFLGEKLRITGPADLLVDIRKYLDFIVGSDEERLTIIEEIQTFAQLVGHRIYGQIDVDVIQKALQTPHLTWIHKQAKTLAQIAGNRLYLEWRNAGQWKHPESTVLCGDHIHCVKFVGSRGGNFIAGLSNGCIQLCDLESSAVCHVFLGHSDTVTSLSIFPISSAGSGGHGKSQRNNGHGHAEDVDFKVLSSSEDKTCKLWNMKLILDEIEAKPYELKTGRLGLSSGISPSPKLRHEHWPFDQDRDDSYLTFQFHTAPVSCAAFSFDGSLIVSTSMNEIMIWSSATGQIISKLSPAFESFRDLNFKQCLFPPELSPSYLICSAENQIVLLSSLQSSLYTLVEAHPMRIVELIFLTDEEFCSVSESEIGLWKISKSYSTAKASKTKASRSRSLSPSRCIQMMRTSSRGRTGADSKSKTMKLKSAMTLDPKDIAVNWTGNLNGSGNGDEGDEGEGSTMKSSRSANESITVMQPANASIDDGNIAIHVVKEGVLRNKSSGILLCAAVTCSEDGRGRIIACGTSDHKILLWRLDQRQYLGNFTSHTGWVTCLDFSCVDLCAILSGSEDHTVMVWDIQEEEKGTKEPQKNVWFSSACIPYNFDQNYFITIFSTEKNTIQLYRDSKRFYESMPFENSITSVAISEDGKLAAAGMSNGGVFSINVEEILPEAQRKSQNYHPSYLDSLDSKVISLKFGFHGKYLVAGTIGGSFMVFEDNVVVQKFIISKAPYLNSHFIFQKYVVAVAQDSSTMVIDPRNRSNMLAWKSGLDVHITFTDCSIDGLNLALGTSSVGVIILELSEDNQNQAITITEKSLAKGTSPVRSLAFNTNASSLAIGYDNGLISIWNLGEGVPRKDMELILHKSWVRHLKFSPDAVGNFHWLISCGDKLAVWNLDKHEVKQRRPSFMTERRRRRSGESPARNPNRLSLEIPIGNKIGRQGKRELLQHLTFRGNFAQHFVTDPGFSRILTVDDTGIFYMLETLKSEQGNPTSAKIPA